MNSLSLTETCHHKMLYIYLAKNYKKYQCLGSARKKSRIRETLKPTMCAASSTKVIKKKLPFTCHLWPMQSATATNLTPADSPTMHFRQQPTYPKAQHSFETIKSSIPLKKKFHSFAILVICSLTRSLQYTRLRAEQEGTTNKKQTDIATYRLNWPRGWMSI